MSNATQWITFGGMAVPVGGGGGGGQYTNTLVNGLNSNVQTNNLPTLRLSGPTGAFYVGGWAIPAAATPSAGQTFDAINTSPYPMTVVNQDPSTSAIYRIALGSGVSLTLAPYASTRFVYDGTQSRWTLQNSGAARLKHYDMRDFGAIGDGQRVTDGAITSGTSLLTCATSNKFTAADVGKLITVYGAGAAGGILACTINGYVSASQVTLAVNAGTTVASGGVVRWGTDNHAAIVAALTAAVAAAVSGYSAVAEVYLAPGEYCVSAGIVFGSAYNGVYLHGASSGALDQSLICHSKITLMNAAAYLVQDTAQGARWSDIWLDGNRLATDVVQFAYLCTTQTFDRCAFSGATAAGNIHHYSNVNGELEIDIMAFRDCRLSGDFLDGTYYVANIVFNENNNAFQSIDYWGGVTYQGNVHWNLFKGSVNVHATQCFQWTTACILVQTFCQPCVFEDVYNERDTAYFLKIEPSVGATESYTFTLRNCQLNGATAIYTAHTMRLKLENLTTAGNIYSDPAAATLFGLGYGYQLVESDNTTFIGGGAFIYTSGTPKSLVEEIATVTSYIETVNVADGAMSSSALLTCATSHPFNIDMVGVPISVAGAGVAGATLYTWIVGYSSTSSVVLGTAASGTVSGAAVVFGDIYSGNGVPVYGSAQTVTRLRAPSQIVNVNTGYDAGGTVYLGCGKTPVGPGVPIIAADHHQISALTENRTFRLSILGVAEPGVRIRVTRYGATDAFTATIAYDAAVPSTVVLAANQWADFIYTNSNEWVLAAAGVLPASGAQPT